MMRTTMIEEKVTDTYKGPVIIRYGGQEIEAEAELEDVQETRVTPTFGGGEMRSPGYPKVRGTVRVRRFQGLEAEGVAEFLDRAYVEVALGGGAEVRGRLEAYGGWSPNMHFSGERLYRGAPEGDV
jgi:hypothetical protein